MAKRKRSYDLNMKVTVETTITVDADSYEDALIKGRQLGVKDIVEFDTDYNDGSVAIIGLYSNNEEPHK